MSTLQRFVDGYTEKIVERPFLSLGLILLAMVILASGAPKVKTVDQQTEDLLPSTISSVHAFDTINAEFSSASGTSYTILFTASPSYANSTEVRDLRDSEFLRYQQRVSNDISSMDKVVSVSSLSSLVDNPSSIRDTQKQLDAVGKSRWSRFLSTDYRSAIVRVTATDLNSDQQTEMADRIKQSVETLGKPAGVKVSYTGNPFINQAFQEQTQSTMSITSALSLLGVIIVIVLLFRSFISGMISLNALIFGIMTGFGFYGWLGLNMSPATSGAISMGMGIAIDFGIQVVSRYREEREEMSIQKSLSKTFMGVISPMTIALIAAIIGFTSLSVGRITFLSSLGMMLILTTTFAYIGALTLIPVALVIYDKHFKKYIPEDLYSGIGKKILR
ncbi:MAG: MMPL family transporter [Candidatus Nanohaloarchaea archaeon]